MVEFARSTAVPHLEVRRSCQENSCYRAHTHEAFSIGMIDGGTSVFAGPPDDRVRLEPGDVIVIAADRVHSCNPDDGSWLYRMVHMDQGWAHALVATEGASALFSGVTVLRAPEAYRRAVEWSELIFDDAPASRLESGLATLLEALGAAAPRHTVRGTSDPALLERLAPVLHRLREAERNPSLEELGRLVGLSRYEVARAVKRATGLAPLAWRQNTRIAQARRLLRGGHPIAQTAQDLGFTDQSHFHRVFRSHVAAPPGAYRV